MPRRFVILVVLGAGFAAPVVGASPLGDDAGSGGDAGSIAALAVAVEAGRYRGGFYGPSDVSDLYSFQARAGDVVKFEIESHADVEMILVAPEAPLDDIPPHRPLQGMARPGRAFAISLPQSGTWFFEVQSFEEGLGPITYEFAFDFPPGFVGDSTVGEHARVLELHAPEPVDVWLFCSPGGRGEHAGDTNRFCLSEWLTAGQWRFGAVAQISGGLGKTVGVSPPAGPIATLPSPALPVLRHGGAAILVTLREFQGSIRVVGYSINDTDSVSVAAAASGPVEVRTGAPTPPMRWGDEEAEAGIHVLTPVASITGERALPLDVHGRYVGLFHAFGYAGTATDPAGIEHDPDPGFPIFLIDAMEGRWDFFMPATVGVGAGYWPIDSPSPLGASRTYVSALNVPSLGLVPLHFGEPLLG